MSESLSFFGRSKHPYYIMAPDYRQSSGGIRALHYLCHALNEIGEEAYIATPSGVVSPRLRTPVLSECVIQHHSCSALTPIAVYPEVTIGNPFNLPTVARWLLNTPGHIGGSKVLDENELLFFWDDWVISPEISAQKLQIPIVDRDVFHPPPIHSERKGICYYANKFTHYGGSVSQFLIENGTSLCLDIPRSPTDIAEILRQSQVFYCYEPSSLTHEALACGCPVKLIASSYLDQFRISDGSPFPIIYESTISDFCTSKIEPTEIIGFFDKIEKSGLQQLRQFIAQTQHAASKCKSNIPIFFNSENVTDSNLKKTNNPWERERQRFKSIDAVPASLLPEQRPFVTILCEVTFRQVNSLASTIDAISKLGLPWHLIVITDIGAPPELAEIDCIHWLSSTHTNAKTLKSIISQLQTDWIIEIPPGTCFDQRLILALIQIDRGSVRALFADNDYYNVDNQHHSPRFKPGVNPAALMSADLAGPLCITRDVWLTLDRSPEHPAPWLISLWQIANKYGWHCIKHLPQVLFSLPDSVRHAPPGLIASLEAELANRATPAHLQAINPACWSVLWQLPQTPPSVQILVQTDGDLGLLNRCIEAISVKTDYSAYSLGLLVSHQVDTDRDPDLSDWLQAHQARNPQTSLWQQGDDEAYSTFLNRVVTTVDSEFVLFFADELVVLQTDWLNELVRACQPSTVVGASPRLIQPQTGLIENCGYVLGLQGWRGSAYFHQTRVQTPDDFDWIDASRDITTLTTTCALIRKEALNKLGGFDDLDVPTPGLNSGFGLMLADFSLRCFKKGQRMIYAPRATLAGRAEPTYPKRNSLSTLARQSLADDARFNCFKSRWWPEFAHDPFWNPNLSLVDQQPTLETDFYADWMANPKPISTPKILAHVIDNAQADFRVTDALGHLKQLQRVSTCVWVQRIDRPARLLTASEINRLNPDIHIVQNYVNNLCLAALDDWHKMPKRPFTVFALDDVVTAIDPSSPFFKNFSPDTRTSLSYALARCDRMVVSTDFLADYYRNFISDIRVVPNRLEMKKWLPLATQKRQRDRVRIGWAGGTTHQRDLMLLKEVIEQTRDEADWVFFGMCPPEIAPLLTESHPFIPYADYPAFLANLGLDLAVAPLAETIFNRGKSNLRLLELGILGLPVVCTDIDPYQNSPACRVKNSVPEWVSALRERIHDPDAREREGRTMRQWVLQNYLLDNHLDEWLDAHTPG